MLIFPHRVIALAYKKLDPELGTAGMRSLPRTQVESDLVFAGFAILQCPLKAESEPALRQLRDSSHQLVMITGDAPLTAVHAASRVHIVDRPALILQHRWEVEIALFSWRCFRVERPCVYVCLCVRVSVCVCAHACARVYLRHNLCI